MHGGLLALGHLQSHHRGHGIDRGVPSGLRKLHHHNRGRPHSSRKAKRKHFRPQDPECAVVEKPRRRGGLVPSQTTGNGS